MRYAFFQGSIVPEHEAKVSVYDSALTTGDRTTEVVRTFDREPFKLGLHLDRFFDGLAELGFEVGMTKTDFTEITHELLELNMSTEPRSVEWQIAYVVTRGLESLFHLFEPQKPTIIILCFPLHHRLSAMAEKYRSGVTLLVSSQRAIPGDLMPPQIKSRGRVHFKLAQLEVRLRNPNASPLLLDGHGHLTESSGSNLFLARNGKLYTPRDSVLPGITREFVMELASRLGIAVLERDIHLEEVPEFDEAFITSSILGMLHVNRIESHAFREGVGPVTERIRQEFYQQVGVDLVEQAQRYKRLVKAVPAEGM